MSDRCSVTELLVEQCAHCRPPAPAADPFDEPTPKLGSSFEARYPGQCSDCGDRFDAGDEIRSDLSGGYICADCAEDQADEARLNDRAVRDW